MTTQGVVAIGELGEWNRKLEQIARGGLGLCPGFAGMARRFEGWWEQGLVDRPIFMGETNGDRGRGINRRLELLREPGAWFEAKKKDLMQTHRVGDMLPNIRVDFGPVLLGALVGGKTEIGADTTWTHAFIDDEWSNEPGWGIQEDGEWWGLLKRLVEMVAKDGAGQYLLRTPDVGGSADVLLNLRGSAELCLDVMERPERLVKAQEAIYGAWHKTFCAIYEGALKYGTGVIHWLNLWSNRVYGIPACDFSYMIGPREFERTCLPDIARQAATVGRAVYHLDGGGAARHVEALLEVPEIRAIQFTPGSGSPSALKWVDMFRRIQEKGRSLLVITRPEEVVELSGMLKPEGLAILVDGEMTVPELDELFKRFGQRYKGGD